MKLEHQHLFNFVNWWRHWLLFFTNNSRCKQCEGRTSWFSFSINWVDWCNRLCAETTSPHWFIDIQNTHSLAERPPRWKQFFWLRAGDRSMNIVCFDDPAKTQNKTLILICVWKQSSDSQHFRFPRQLCAFVATENGSEGKNLIILCCRSVRELSHTHTELDETK